MPTGFSTHAVGAVLVGFHDFARHGGQLRIGEPPFEPVVRPLEPDSKRVTVDRLQPLDPGVVVEDAALAGGGERLVQADQVALEEIQPVRPDLRIEDALDAVDVVVGGQFAPLALESGVRGEIDPGFDLDRIGAPFVGDLRQRGGGVGHDAHRPREIVVDVQRIENRADDGVRIDVAGRLRIESGFGDGERDVERLAHVGGSRGRCGAGHAGQGKKRQAQEHRTSGQWSFARREASSYTAPWIGCASLRRNLRGPGVAPKRVHLGHWQQVPIAALSLEETH